jgi:hypothetical protein
MTKENKKEEKIAPKMMTKEIKREEKQAPKKYFNPDNFKKHFIKKTVIY